jgi:hypothetical protein
VRRSSTPSSSGIWVVLASRSGGTGDLPPRDAVTPGSRDVRTWGKGNPFRSTPSKDEHTAGPSDPPFGARRPITRHAGMMSGVATHGEPSQEERVRLRRAHERVRAASKDLQSLVATDPMKGRWEPERAPGEILEAAREELRQAYAGLTACQAEILGWVGEMSAIDVVDGGRRLSFSYEDMMRYHGPGSPGGVAHAFKVMERAFPLLDPDGRLERREITVATAFGGPGARDGFETVARAVTGNRYVLDPKLARPERGTTLERFVFRVGYRKRSVTLVVREGFVTDEFIALASKERSPEEEARLDLLKQEMAERVMSSPAADVYDATRGA